jgi:hypothetical protein
MMLIDASILIHAHVANKASAMINIGMHPSGRATRPAELHFCGPDGVTPPFRFKPAR